VQRNPRATEEERRKRRREGKEEAGGESGAAAAGVKDEDHDDVDAAWTTSPSQCPIDEPGVAARPARLCPATASTPRGSTPFLLQTVR
jgi:hypothetical protein